MNNNEPVTVAENMISQLTRIADSLDNLRKQGLPETLVMAYVQKKTKLSQRDIKLVFDALRDMNKELKRS